MGARMESEEGQLFGTFYQFLCETDCMKLGVS